MKGAEINEALERELAAHSSFIFALLPHAPRLEELNALTPPLLRWASLVAHAAPENLHAVPKDLRTGGVARLLELLDASAAATRAERGAEEYEAATVEILLSDVRAEGEADGRAEGKAEGRAEGKAELLRSVGINSVATYRARFGVDPPSDVAHLLEQIPAAL
jgi:hypothetical protein